MNRELKAVRSKIRIFRNYAQLLALSYELRQHEQMIEAPLPAAAPQIETTPATPKLHQRIAVRPTALEELRAIANY